jgi:hypothetical protein
VSQIFASAGAQQISGRTQEAGAREPRFSGKSTGQIFSEGDLAKLAGASKVYVAGFSSQGGGHTERMLMPLEATIKADRAADRVADSVADRAADLVARLANFDLTDVTSGAEREQGRTAIVLVLPPHWEVDTGNEATKLASYKAAYESQNVDVVTVQSDKAILGFYEPDGPSDNFAILKEFADKPNRDNSQIPLFGPERGAEPQKGPGFTHHSIMQQVMDTVGDRNKVTVFEDMDPYLAKAADLAGVPKAHIVGQSNHLLLLDADQAGYFAGKSDAFLVKANGNGHIGNVATVEFNSNINTTGPLGKSLDSLGIKPQDKAVDVRRQMVQMLLDGGKKHDLESDAVVSMSGCVLVAPEATADNIDRGVYIYLNKYTDPLAQHIRNRLNGDGTPEQVAAYKNSMFVVCGAGTFDAASGTTGNAMHVGQAANFDAVTAAGFGTSSEMQYLISNDAYQGNLLLMPVERQHEQEANAEVLLPKALGDRADRVDTAKNIGELRDKLDNMVVNKATSNAKLEGKTIQSLYDATHAKGPQATDKAVERLTTKTGMTADESRLLEENTRRAESPDRKALRHLNKMMIPALTALSKGETSLQIRMTAKDEPKTVMIKDVMKALREPDRATELLNADFSSEGVQGHMLKCADWLEGLMNLGPGSVRKQAAENLMRGPYANETYILGY